MANDTKDKCMTTNRWVDIIKQVGFPIAVCGYLLWERHTYLLEVTATMKDLVTKIEVLIQTVGH